VEERSGAVGVAVGRIGTYPPATFGGSPDIPASGVVPSGPSLVEASVSADCARPGGAARPVIPRPEVGGVLTYVWGRGVGSIASPGGPQLGTLHGSAAALCFRARSYAASSVTGSEVICSLGTGRALASRTFLRAGASQRHGAPGVLVECGTEEKEKEKGLGLRAKVRERTRK
jgi:hypothetical protein